MDRYQWFMSNVFGWKFDWLPGEIEDFSQSIQHSLLKQFHHCPLYNLSINYLFIYLTPPKPCVLLNRLPYYVILISSLRDCKIHKFCIFDFLIRITQWSKSLCVLISSRVNIYYLKYLFCDWLNLLLYDMISKAVAIMDFEPICRSTVPKKNSRQNVISKIEVRSSLLIIS